MTLQEWVEREGRGAITVLHRRSGISVSRIRECLEGKPMRNVPKARLLSEATGGEVSVETLLGLDSGSESVE